MRRRSRITIIALLILTAFVIVFALFFMGRDPNTAGVSLPSPGQDDGSGEDYTGPERITLSPDNVLAAIAELERAESYSCTVTVEDYWPGGGGSSAELQVWVDSGSVRVRGQQGGGTRNVLVSGGTLYIWYDAVAGVFSAPYSGSSDRWLRSLTYEELLDLSAEDISSAGYTQYSGAECVYCRFTDPLTGYSNAVYVSVSTGLLMGAETWDGGELIYRMYSSLPELSRPDAELFSPPGA